MRRIIALTILTLSTFSCVVPFGINITSPPLSLIESEPIDEVFHDAIINYRPYKFINIEEIRPREETVEKEIEYTTYTLPKTRGFKSYMSYKAITNKQSKQYKLQNEYAQTNKHGIRVYDDRYCIAIGTAYNAKVGTYVDLVLHNGTIIPCIVGDFKADIHTDQTNMITLSNGCVSEFIVDTKALYEKARRAGDMSLYKEEWNSSVKEILVYEQNVFETN